jgi:hypothetical protein
LLDSAREPRARACLEMSKLFEESIGLELPFEEPTSVDLATREREPKNFATEWFWRGSAMLAEVDEATSCCFFRPNVALLVEEER